MIPQFVRLTLQRIAILLVVYFTCRFLFLVWNWPLYKNFPASDLVWAFVVGARFDLSAIVLTNLIVIALWLLPARWTSWRWLSPLELSLFALVNLISVGSNVADAEFVKFIGKRSGFDMLLIHQDLEQQGVSVLMSYWYFCLMLAGLIGIAAWKARPLRNLAPCRTWWSGALWRAGTAGVLVVAARGGFQLKPLHPMHAYFSTHHELGLLALNTPFNVIKSRPREGIERQRYFDSDRDAVAHLREITKLTRPPLGLAKKFNVVVILVESLSAEYVGAVNAFPGYTPFLDSLARESFFYKYNFANSRRSIEGLPAVACGIPAIMAEPVITSEFANNRYQCLPDVLGRQGYSTYFLHGAHNGSMHFDTFSKIAGFENFVGLNEYPKDNPEDLDPYWGVLDEPMLQYAVKVMDDAPKPATMTVFTLSSHHPYYIPPKYKGRFPKGTLDIHESIGYADYAIRRFFAEAKTHSWFNNTIFVITGDHTQKYDHQEYANFLGAYRVPLFIYVPGLKNANIGYDPDRITQHIDVVPSVMDLLGIELPDPLLVGQSVFDLGSVGRAYNFNSPSYYYLDPKVYFHMDRAGNIQHLQRHAGRLSLFDEGVDPAALSAGLLNLKSIVHYLNEGLIRNNLYGWRRVL